MKINAVLQKYPELERPEAVFEISNIANSFIRPMPGEAAKNGWGKAFYYDNSLYNKIERCVIKPPFKSTWYEYSWRDGSTRCILIKREACELAITTFFATKDNCISKLDRTTLYLPQDLAMNRDTLSLGIYQSYRSTEELLDIKTNSTDAENMAYLVIFFLPALHVNALLNCKNVSTDAHDFPNRRSISHYKKTGKPYFEKYYTLKVKLPGKKHTAGNGENGGWSNAFHIYRGHFKTYTEAAPLFGKLTGTYWWESGIRGNLETGIIDKDYELEAGE